MFSWGPHIGQSVFVVAALVCMLSLSMAVVLRNCQPARPFFAAFGVSRAREEKLRAAVRADVVAQGLDAAGRGDAVPLGIVGFDSPGVDASVSGDEALGERDTPDFGAMSLRSRCDALQARFGLTDRERDMAWYLAQGRSKSAISQELHLSENTVKGYTRGMYSKLCIHSKQELLDMLQGDWE